MPGDAVIPSSAPADIGPRSLISVTVVSDPCVREARPPPRPYRWRMIDLASGSDAMSRQVLLHLRRHGEGHCAFALRSVPAP